MVEHIGGSRVWMEENMHAQVNHCRVCYKPILLADWAKQNYRARPGVWETKDICLPPLGDIPNNENNPCHVIANNWYKTGLRFGDEFSRAEAVSYTHLTLATICSV